jgi:hypothetical protein
LIEGPYPTPDRRAIDAGQLRQDDHARTPRTRAAEDYPPGRHASVIFLAFAAHGRDS